jgi:hypothetical protein
MSHESLTSAQMLRRFPWKLYSYVFGAASLGWGIGVDMPASLKESVTALVVGFVLCMIGFVGMRPYMRASALSIDEQAKERALEGAGTEQ